MKKQNAKKVTMWMRLSLFVAVFVLQAAIWGQNALVVNAQGTAKVSAASGKIRASASTSSEVLASVTKGNKLDVISQTTDEDGYTWYKVYVDGQKKGYIRADLVSNVKGTIKTESASDAQSNDSNTESENEPTQQVQFVQVNPSEATAGKIIGADSVNVRENPSTSAAVAGKANQLE